MKEIYVQKDSEYTEHSNAYATFSDIFLSDNLFKHHEDPEEILAIVCHEICHDKYHHILKGAIVDVCYMVLYGVGVSFMVQYGNPIVSSFGFTYNSTFISLFLFHSIWIEIPDFFLRLGINWNFRRNEYTADKFAHESNYGPQLRKALIIMFVKNEDHLSPDYWHTLVNKDHPNLNQRIDALDML
eukprot:CAMPEP_0116881832 /NCGR_PEP_ID=MMETSP0463-20121206/13888_1 /TAXON_ID=181622 /ORGANISM="Strombidinopsis sp, Strain SopsisLIS2011" /LENGTH=184 /DNA_ID=CAMNT_0004534059 /DNA_START=745 /DNA_END=1299 /DNA_ORIENTATION=-